jgi:hypothetical protein
MEEAMRSGEMRSVIGGALCLVAAAGLVGCGTTTTYGRTSEELPSHRMTGMEPSGTVTRLDETQQVIVLDNGRMYRVVGNDAVYIDGRPVAFRTVRPGSRVTIVNGTPVVYQNGQYVVVQQPPSTGAVAPGGVLTSPPPAVVTSPGTTVVQAPPAAVATVPGTVRMTGRVTDVDRREIRVKLDNGESFEFRPPAGMVFRKGDPVTIDMTVGGSPSALPR